MKVYINNYKNNWISPYTVKQKFFFWKKDYDAFKNKPPVWLEKICHYWYVTANFFNRKIDYVKIDRWDTWNMDHTLSLIVVPMLKDLKVTKHGAPFVDPEDVPKKLRPTAKQLEKFNKSGETDPKHFQRWEWIMDEMIWAHEQIIDENSDEKFWIEHGEIDWEAGEPDENGCTPLVWKKPSKVDWKGLKAHHERIDNGLKLFGKYYRNLWD